MLIILKLLWWHILHEVFFQKMLSILDNLSWTWRITRIRLLQATLAVSLKYLVEIQLYEVHFKQSILRRVQLNNRGDYPAFSLRLLWKRGPRSGTNFVNRFASLIKFILTWQMVVFVVSGNGVFPFSLIFPRWWMLSWCIYTPLVSSSSKGNYLFINL